MKTEAIRFCIQAQHGKEDYAEARKELNALLERIAQLEAAQQSVQPTLGGRCVLQCTFCGGIIPDHNLPCPAAQSG